jgi:hypothetical protein
VEHDALTRSDLQILQTLAQRQDWNLPAGAREKIIARLVEYATAVKDDGTPRYAPRIVMSACRTLALLSRLNLSQQSLDARAPAPPDEFDARAALTEALEIARGAPPNPDHPQPGP